MKIKSLKERKKRSKKGRRQSRIVVLYRKRFSAVTSHFIILHPFPCHRPPCLHFSVILRTSIVCTNQNIVNLPMPVLVLPSCALEIPLSVASTIIDGGISFVVVGINIVRCFFHFIFLIVHLLLCRVFTVRFGAVFGVKLVQNKQKNHVGCICFDLDYL